MTARTLVSTSLSVRTPEALKSRPVGVKRHREGVGTWDEYGSHGRITGKGALPYREAPEAGEHEARLDPEIQRSSPSPWRQRRASQTRGPAFHAHTWCWPGGVSALTRRQKKARWPQCGRGLSGGSAPNRKSGCPPKEPRVKCTKRVGGRSRVVCTQGHRRHVSAVDGWSNPVVDTIRLPRFLLKRVAPADATWGRSLFPLLPLCPNRFCPRDPNLSLASRRRRPLRISRWL